MGKDKETSDAKAKKKKRIGTTKKSTASKTSKKARSSEKKHKEKMSSKKIPLYGQLIVRTRSFLTDLDCFEEMFSVIIPVLKQKDDERNQEIKRTIKHLERLSKKKVETRRITVERGKLFVELLNKLMRADYMFRCNCIVGIVARYDTFVGDVLRIYFRAHPDQLKSPEKTLTFDEILELKSVNRALDVFINKEIDKVLRDSHLEQLKYIDDRLKLGLRDQYEFIDEFVELTERRNLFTHADGIVNKQYIQNCKLNKIKLDPEIRVGTRLLVSEDYFGKAYKCFYTLAVRIGQSVLRKLFNDKLKQADATLSDIGFLQLQKGKWDLAKSVFDFACSIPSKYISDDSYYRLYVINLCICQKQLGQKKSVLELLETLDWSASESRYKLAVHILKEEYDKAEEIMSRLKRNDPFDETAYRTWPIFLDFRKTKNFSRAFKSIYKKDFEPMVVK